MKVVTWRVPSVDAAALESLSVPEDALAPFLDDLKERLDAPELVHFPTCQRVLVAVVTRHDAEETRELVRGAFEARAGRPVPEPETLVGFEAFGHLAEVASALDSLVPGEPQVLGQMKDAFRVAQERGLVGRGGRGLTHVFPLVFRTAKAVRTNTDLFRGKVSLIPLTLDLVAEHLRGLADPSAYVVGTGEMGARMRELVAETVPSARVVAVSRSPNRGLALAEFLASPTSADLLAFATSTDRPLFLREHAEAVVRANGGRGLLVVDLSMPRAVATDVATVPGVRLVALDELTALSERAKADRVAELDRARDVLRLELDRVHQEYAMLPAQRALAEYRREMAAAAEARFAAGAERFPDLFKDPEFRKWFEQTTRHLAHVAQTRLRPTPGEAPRE